MEAFSPDRGSVSPSRELIRTSITIYICQTWGSDIAHRTTPWGVMRMHGVSYRGPYIHQHMRCGLEFTRELVDKISRAEVDQRERWRVFSIL